MWSQGCVWFGPVSEDGFANSLLHLAKALTVGTLMGAQVVVKDSVLFETITDRRAMNNRRKFVN